MTAMENVAVPLFRISQLEPPEARARSEALLAFVGLAASTQEPIEALPAYAQHCVSLARALAHRPAVVLVEPLQGEVNADERTRFAALLRRAAREYEVAVIAAFEPDFTAETDDRCFTLGASRAGEPLPLLPEAGP
jgi:predicted ABC-type transport system involved in lysophospholipase L1 biosynthesis ATPase subunit